MTTNTSGTSTHLSGGRAFLPCDAFKRDELSAVLACGDLTFFDHTANQELLARLCEGQGCIVSDPHYGSVYVFEVGKGTAIFRLDSLMWQMSSDKRWTDFPRFLIRHIISDKKKPNRTDAERLAKTIVQAAYYGRWDQLENLIERAKRR